MTQFKTLNVKLSNLEIRKLKSRINNGAEVTWNLSSNAIGDSNGETNFPHELLLTGCQFWDFVNLLRMIHQLI